MISLDLNGDVGEQMGHDSALITMLSSANICCGAHAGCIDHTRDTIKLAHHHHVAIGAHPGYADKANFGRVELNQTDEEILLTLVQQLAQFTELTQSVGAKLHHLKLHGALYHRGNHQTSLASKICRWLASDYPQLVLYCQSNSPMAAIASNIGLTIKQEGFADRRYLNSGLLVPRSHARSCIDNLDEALAQVKQMVTRGSVTTIDHQRLPLAIDTLCLHGDNQHALMLAQQIRQWCSDNQITISANCG